MIRYFFRNVFFSFQGDFSVVFTVPNFFFLFLFFRNLHFWIFGLLFLRVVLISFLELMGRSFFLFRFFFFSICILDSLHLQAISFVIFCAVSLAQSIFVLLSLHQFRRLFTCVNGWLSSSAIVTISASAVLPWAVWLIRTCDYFTIHNRTPLWIILVILAREYSWWYCY